VAFTVAIGAAAQLMAGYLTSIKAAKNAR